MLMLPRRRSTLRNHVGLWKRRTSLTSRFIHIDPDSKPFYVTSPIFYVNAGECITARADGNV
jgi:hypothetical protein